MPPWPTSSSTSYRPAIFSPTTSRTLPGRRAPHAPEAQAEPQASAPDPVEEENQARYEPERDHAALGRLPRRECDQPAESDEPADPDDDARPSEAESSQQKREPARNDGNEEAGHTGVIGG